MKFAAGLLTVLVFTSLAPAEPEATSSGAAAQLARLKALEGFWRVPGEGGKPGPSVRYRTTAAGNTVMETLFEGTPKEMVTMYHLDGDRLLMTHYCSLGNQPRMAAKASQDAKTIELAWLDGTNLKSRDAVHMDALTLTFVDDTHLRHDWTMWKDGKAVQTITLEFAKETK